jgi:chloramphenicol 3-O phosphotransferase
LCRCLPNGQQRAAVADAHRSPEPTTGPELQLTADQRCAVILMLPHRGWRALLQPVTGWPTARCLVMLHGMEPDPGDRGPGRIIVLNGASSSGKSALAKAMQQMLPEPFLHVSCDHLVASGMLPARRDDHGPFAWQRIRPRFFAGSHRCLPALAAAGNDLIVDHVIEYRSWRGDLARLLAGLDVFLIGVHCDLEEIDRRERSRGDRRIGEGRSHVQTDLIHTFGRYDFTIGTTFATPGTPAASVLAAWQARGCRRALWPGPTDP